MKIFVINWQEYFTFNKINWLICLFFYFIKFLILIQTSNGKLNENVYSMQIHHAFIA